MDVSFSYYLDSYLLTAGVKLTMPTDNSGRACKEEGALQEQRGADSPSLPGACPCRLPGHQPNANYFLPQARWRQLGAVASKGLTWRLTVALPWKHKAQQSKAGGRTQQAAPTGRKVPWSRTAQRTPAASHPATAKRAGAPGTDRRALVVHDALAVQP